MSFRGLSFEVVLLDLMFFFIFGLFLGMMEALKQLLGKAQPSTTQNTKRTQPPQEEQFNCPVPKPPARLLAESVERRGLDGAPFF